MFSITVGRFFELSSQRDFLLRVGQRQLHWSRGWGWTLERVEGSRRID